MRGCISKLVMSVVLSFPAHGALGADRTSTNALCPAPRAGFNFYHRLGICRPFTNQLSDFVLIQRGIGFRQIGLHSSPGTFDAAPILGPLPSSCFGSNVTSVAAYIDCNDETTLTDFKSSITFSRGGSTSTFHFTYSAATGKFSSAFVSGGPYTGRR